MEESLLELLNNPAKMSNLSAAACLGLQKAVQHYLDGYIRAMASEQRPKPGDEANVTTPNPSNGPSPTDPVHGRVSNFMN